MRNVGHVKSLVLNVAKTLVLLAIFRGGDCVQKSDVTKEAAQGPV